MQNLLRALLVIPQAALVTLLLLGLMVSLTEFADKTPDKRESIKLPDILMPEAEIEFRRVIEKPEKPKIDEKPPPQVPKQSFDRIDVDAPAIAITASEGIDTKLDLNIGINLQAADGEYLPIVKVAPPYPKRALSRGIEGYVILEYTVTRQGTVKEPIIIEAQPRGVFDKAAIKSALGYKYKPRVVDGDPIEVSGVRTKIIFELQD